MNDIYAYIDDHADESIALLRRFCRQPSIAAQGVGMTEMAEMVRAELAPLGAKPELVDTRGGFPVVYGGPCLQEHGSPSFNNSQ